MRLELTLAGSLVKLSNPGHLLVGVFTPLQKVKFFLARNIFLTVKEYAAFKEKRFGNPQGTLEAPHGHWSASETESGGHLWNIFRTHCEIFFSNNQTKAWKISNPF